VNETKLLNLNQLLEEFAKYGIDHQSPGLFGSRVTLVLRGPTAAAQGNQCLCGRGPERRFHRKEG